MSKYNGLFTFDVDNHRFIPVGQADGIISNKYNPEPKEEPKDFWYIKPNGCIERDNLGVIECDIPKEYYDKMVEIGNKFDTEEETEKAVEKLKAWKRLRDNGFEFTGWKRDDKHWGDFTITATDQTSCDDKDLDLLFGGEDDDDEDEDMPTNAEINDLTDMGYGGE